MTCEAPPPTRIIIEPVPPTPTIDTSLDLAALGARMPRQPHASGAHAVLGQTTAQPIGTAEEQLEFARQFGAVTPTVCGAVREIRVRLGFEKAIVHIATEMSRDRCPYDTVLGHEMRHIQVDREVLDWAIPRIEAALRETTTQLGIVRGRTQEAVWAQIRERVQAVFDRELRAMLQERSKRQQLVDRPLELQRVAQACDGLIARLLGASGSR
jgi:hypothetical protein